MGSIISMNTEGDIAQKTDEEGKPILGIFTKSSMTVETFTKKQVELEIARIVNNENLLATRKAKLNKLLDACNEAEK
jgi:hypothetical protein